MANSSGFLYGNALQQCSQSVGKTCRMTCSPKNGGPGAHDAGLPLLDVHAAASCIVVKRSTSLQHFEFRRSAVSHFPLQSNAFSFCNPNVLFHQSLSNPYCQRTTNYQTSFMQLKTKSKRLLLEYHSALPPQNIFHLPMFFCFATLMADGSDPNHLRAAHFGISSKMVDPLVRLLFKTLGRTATASGSNQGFQAAEPSLGWGFP